MFPVLIALKVWTLYMDDSCTLNMNNVGWGRLVERQTIIEEIIFHINTKTFATSILWFKLLSFYVGIKYDFVCINIC